MKSLSFSGYTWLVAESKNKKIGPQESYYASSPKNVWVDTNGYLHLKVTQQGPYHWDGAQVSLAQTLGYGIYNFFLIGRVDLFEEYFIASCSLDKDETSKVAMHFSLWTPAKNMAYPYKEIKSNNVEYIARRGNASAWPGGDSLLTRIDLNGTYTTHRIIWQPKSLSFLSLHGHYEAEPPTPDFVIKQFQYRLADYPVSDTERVTVSISEKKDRNAITT
jgi:hypothetical protein